MALNFKTLLTRTLTAAVFVAVLLSSICYNYLSFTFLFLIISVWGLFEFFKIAEKLGAHPYKLISYITATVLYCSVLLQNIGFRYSDFVFNVSIGFLFLILVNALFSKNEKPIQDVAYSLFGIIYIVIPFFVLNKLVCLGEPGTFGIPVYNPHLILGPILLIWASDSFAYLVGSMIGKRKLYERISPGKTWEGTIGGGVLTMASSYLIAGWFPEIEFKHWLVISLLVVVFGTLGDLFESMLKRQAGIKDSGKIMPGHGGILDRFDSLIFVTPFVYLYLSWVLS